MMMMQHSGYNFSDLVQEAQHRWLKPPEVIFILKNYEESQVTDTPLQKPPGGTLFLLNKRFLRYFRNDGHSWSRKKDGRTVKEAHERLKVDNAEALNCFYAHGELNPSFQRRIYCMLDPAYDHIVLVHYRDIAGVKEQIESVQEDLMHRIQCNLSRQGNTSEPRSLRLMFSRNVNSLVFTGSKIIGEGGISINLALVDSLNGEVVKFGHEAAAEIEILVLKGDYGGHEGCNGKLEDFNNRIVSEMEGRKSILQGTTTLRLKEGISKIDDLSFTHNSRWMRKSKWCLGARAVNSFPGTTIEPAKTESFILKDQRTEYDDYSDLVQVAQYRWLKPLEVLFILKHYDSQIITDKPLQKPPGGSLFLFNRRVLRYFRKDGHSWRKKDGRTVIEAHERLKVDNAEALNCFYAHGELNPSFQRRIYCMLDPAYDHNVLVHYRDIAGAWPKYEDHQGIEYIRGPTRSNNLYPEIQQKYGYEGQQDIEYIRGTTRSDNEQQQAYEYESPQGMEYIRETTKSDITMYPELQQRHGYEDRHGIDYIREPTKSDITMYPELQQRHGYEDRQGIEYIGETTNSDVTMYSEVESGHRDEDWQGIDVDLF